MVKCTCKSIVHGAAEDFIVIWWLVVVVGLFLSISYIKYTINMLTQATPYPYRLVEKENDIVDYRNPCVVGRLGGTFNGGIFVAIFGFLGFFFVSIFGCPLEVLL